MLLSIKLFDALLDTEADCDGLLVAVYTAEYSLLSSSPELELEYETEPFLFRIDFGLLMHGALRSASRCPELVSGLWLCDSGGRSCGFTRGIVLFVFGVPAPSLGEDWICDVLLWIKLLDVLLDTDCDGLLVGI